VLLGPVLATIGTLAWVLESSIRSFPGESSARSQTRSIDTASNILIYPEERRSHIGKDGCASGRARAKMRRGPSPHAGWPDRTPIKIVGQVDGQEYSFKSFCGWRRRCDWLLPGEFPARWTSRSRLEVEYHDNKGQLKTEKIYVLEVYDATK